MEARKISISVGKKQLAAARRIAKREGLSLRLRGFHARPPEGNRSGRAARRCRGARAERPARLEQTQARNPRELGTQDESRLRRMRIVFDTGAFIALERRQ